MFLSCKAGLCRRTYCGERRRWEACFCKRSFFANSVLADFQKTGTGVCACDAGGLANQSRIDILEFERNHVTQSGHFEQALLAFRLGSGRGKEAIGGLSRWTVGVHIEDRNVEAESLRRMDEHPPQLTATQDANPAAGRDNRIVVQAWAPLRQIHESDSAVGLCPFLRLRF